MKHIGNIRYAEGSKKKRKRIARGVGSGHGGTSTKGHKGQQSRSGYGLKRSFEGGQMSLNRRVPKFGFFNRFRTIYEIVNVGRLQELVDSNRFAGDEITPETLLKLGVVNKSRLPVKILGDGELKTALKVKAHKFTNSAIQKIEAAGGTVTING